MVKVALARENLDSACLDGCLDSHIVVGCTWTGHCTIQRSFQQLFVHR